VADIPMPDRPAEIAARAAAATPGPWEVDPGGWQVRSGVCNICGTFHCHQMHDGGRTDGEHPIQPDADFIAHAREDIPWLLAELARRETQIERMIVLIKRQDELLGSLESDLNRHLIPVVQAARRRHYLPEEFSTMCSCGMGKGSCDELAALAALDESHD